MKIIVDEARQQDAGAWDDYLLRQGSEAPYLAYGWKRVIEDAYGHPTFYLVARTGGEGAAAGALRGVLPLVHLNHPLFGNSLVSIPFFDAAGVLADDQAVEEALVARAVELGEKLGVRQIELRQQDPLRALEAAGALPAVCTTRCDKARMVLEIPATPDDLMKSFGAKLRSQIRRPLKDGLIAKTGGEELLDDFYRVFCRNMRDLGSPVHSRRMMESAVRVFGDRARVVVVYDGAVPVACSMVVGAGITLANPWASSLREHSRKSPNMLLYWTMLEYAAEHGYERFDFGRSTPGGGTCRFKEQWGASPKTLHWHSLLQADTTGGRGQDARRRFAVFERMWKVMPVPVTRVLGPRIRKHISL